MQIKEFNAIYNICKKADYPQLQYVVAKNGYIYSSDSYIAFRISTPETREKMLDRTPVSFDTNSLSFFKPNTYFDISVYSHEHEEKYPDIDAIFETPASDKIYPKINPKILSRALKVFEIFDSTSKEFVYPIITDEGTRLRLKYEDSELEIDCIVMKAVN